MPATLKITEEFLSLSGNVICSSSINPHIPIQSSWMPPEYGTPKVNIDVAFSEGKPRIGTLVHSRLGIPLLAQSIPLNGSTIVDYKEMLNITKGCSVGMSFSVRLLFQSDSLSAIWSLVGRSSDFSELGRQLLIFWYGLIDFYYKKKAFYRRILPTDGNWSVTFCSYRLILLTTEFSR